MIEVTAHVTCKSSIDYLESCVVLRQPEHVTTKMELFLPHVSHSLTYDLSNVLSHYCVLFSKVSNKQTQPVYL